MTSEEVLRIEETMRINESARYDIVYADPPWSYYGDPNKMAAAGKHYNLMSQDELAEFPVRLLMKEKAALFLWATCPRLNFAIEMIERWGLHYRGVAYVWVKTRKDGKIISGQGIPPTFTKPTVEMLLVASTCKRGRPFPIKTYSQAQVVLHERLEHSRKPAIFRERIEELCGKDKRKIELFAREAAPGWNYYGELKWVT